jgi:hypothetical protein
MSSFSNIMQRIRTKSFSSEKSYYAPQPPLGYHYVENFDNVTEEDCIKFDNQNKEIYKKNMELYEQISKKMENKNALFKIDSPPSPPDVLNNYEKYIKHKLRNTTKNVRYQSYATQYLLNKGYKLIFDNFDQKTELEFEAYEAIGLIEKIENSTIELILNAHTEPKVTYPAHSQQTDRKSITSVYPPAAFDYNQQYNQYNQYHHYNSYPSIYPAPPPPPPPASPSQPILPPTNIYNQYQLSASSPQLTLSPSLSTQYTSTEIEKQKQHISGPPAAHYVSK